MRGGDHLGAASSAATPPTSLPTAKRKKLDSYNKYDYTNWNDYSKGDNKKNCFGDKKKKF
jgi:hypothetical protein